MRLGPGRGLEVSMGKRLGTGRRLVVSMGKRLGAYLRLGWVWGLSMKAGYGGWVWGLSMEHAGTGAEDWVKHHD